MEESAAKPRVDVRKTPAQRCNELLEELSKIVHPIKRTPPPPKSVDLTSYVRMLAKPSQKQFQVDLPSHLQLDDNDYNENKAKFERWLQNERYKTGPAE